MSTGVLSARVRQGIALMDLHHGAGWVWKVDPDTLNLNSVCGCVVGQVGQRQDVWDYDAELRRMGLDPCAESEVGAGFFEVSVVPGALTRIWVYAIRRLREQRPQAVAS